MAIEFVIGGEAPCNQKASNAVDDLCFVCGRALGKNPLYFEVNTSWELLPIGNLDPDTQGCFPVGVSCANKFENGILFRMPAERGENNG